MVNSFHVHRRNPGHWDITTEQGRIFRIRGGPGSYWIADERNAGANQQPRNFNTVSACMAYICDELMYELLYADGQKPAIIERWNINS